MSDVVKSCTLMIVLLNPFALSVYLIDILRKCTIVEFARIMFRASGIAGTVFALFALTGEAVFTNVLQVRFAAFQVFGGLLFLVVALRFMLSPGGEALVTLRGEPSHLAGAVAMPFLIGPGTVSAATMAGVRVGPVLGVASIVAALALTGSFLLVFKWFFDAIQAKNTALTQRYVETASRVTAMVLGTIAVEMLFQGLESWRGMR